MGCGPDPSAAPAVLAVVLQPDLALLPRLLVALLLQSNKLLWTVKHTFVQKKKQNKIVVLFFLDLSFGSYLIFFRNYFVRFIVFCIAALCFNGDLLYMLGQFWLCVHIWLV